MKEQIEHKPLPDYGSSPEKVMEAHHLSIAFGLQQVLNNISLHLMEGENLVVMGQSGSGKSVLIKCLTRLLEPDAGEIFIFGKEISSAGKKELGSIRKKIGFMFQGGALYDSMTVRENLEFPLKRMFRKITQEECDNKVLEVLTGVGLRDAIDKMPADLSGGMKKRIAMARTLITNPGIIFYDEPTAGLDPITSADITELILKVRKRYKCSSVIITHDTTLARQAADRIILLKEGEIFAEGAPAELENSTHPWIKKFFGKNK
jgi:phospholipid/cholesterol/gamma-HCH transport system ATP-binding protein